MLSILIPIYNFDVTDFVTELHEQCNKCNIPFEILCYDDDSDEKYKKKNQSIKQFENLIYNELDENIGRAKIRNLLAKYAQYNYFLFLDCDLKITSTYFIKNYIDHLNEKAIVNGGIEYESLPPEEKDKFFRWFYGIKRESKPIKERLKNPYQSFLASNVLIPKSIYSTIRFNEDLTTYGYEDTLFGRELKAKGIPVIHIDNPLHHIDIDTTDEFLHKTQQGLHNLAYLIKQGFTDENVKILTAFYSVKKSHFTWLVKLLFKLSRRYLIKNIKSTHPNLYYFDFYKLGYLLFLV